MKRALIATIATLLFASCVTDPMEQSHDGATSQSKIVNPSATPAEGLLLVRLAEGATLPSFSDVAGIAIEAELLIPRSANRELSSLDNWYILRFDKSADVKAIASRIATNEAIDRVEYDVEMKRPEYQSFGTVSGRPEPTRAVEYPFNDPELPWQWHYHNDASLSDDAVAGADINAINAWKYCTGDNRIVVAVVDSGIMFDHPDLEDNMWYNEAERFGLTGVDDDNNGYVDDIYGYNFVKDRGDITPGDHGTHVAGTISAVNNNGYSGCGIAGGTGKGDGVRLMSVQIFDGKDGCFGHQLAKAICYAADNGADIANNSWAYPPYTYNTDKDYTDWNGVLQEAIEYFKAEGGKDSPLDGGLMIFAAGNESSPVADYPGAYYSNVCVSAMAPNFTPAYYTNYGPGVNICAPGGDATYGTFMAISSTSLDLSDGGYEYMHGTSMATPHVTGCAALGLSYALKRGYQYSVDEFRNILLTSVHDINPYMVGSREYFSHSSGKHEEFELAPYKNKLGTGYIDAHLLLMQMDNTPCLYLSTGAEQSLSLDSFFGEASEMLKYESCTMENDTLETLGITEMPQIVGGMLKISCTKPGVGRIKVTAIVGGDEVGGDYNMGGMTVEREIELVVRGSVATNGGWL